MKEIPLHPKAELDFSFYTLVTRFDEYQEMVSSAKSAGFKESVEYFYFDNKNKNEYDGFNGINHALKLCEAKYLIFCHQDILFKYDTKKDLIKKIKEIEKIDTNWGVIGNAGRTKKGEPIIKITDPHADNQTQGPFPSEVMSLDENFIVINMKNNLSCTTTLKGFHLYGLDICQNANYLGLKNYVIDFHLLHKSKGNLDVNFFKSQKEYIHLQEKRKRLEIYYTTCTRFCVTSSKLFNIFLNKKMILSLISKIYKKFSKSNK